MAYNKELIQMLLEAGVKAEEAIRLSVGVRFEEEDETS
tara:strand:+ start:27 stop:140 length:114 start_codon:yes stop_codon:yes gene_type:complete